ncbi:ATP-dependent DNA helicase RecQ [Bacillus sp. H-16]|uniref:RecQ family ATP-dependent DNA helicase n=1 Tax=Alteribacter salitolerans TaxID=2912333 RepID=UPI0019626420|nr:ATP-dependent DNA helicase RecQ [Alteribacter salitolerans]MBM7094695.1 ATP-dependent DNA helicase RecQ [Alteribacter salitolerans]
MNIETALRQSFGYAGFRSGQKEIIKDVLKGTDVLAVLPTGTGKTLCYQFPSRYLKGMTIVVSPLLSLMEDQVHQLKARGEKGAVALNSHVNKDERERIVKTFNDRTLLYVSPEMLQSNWLMYHLKKHRVGLFVVDEAHCISQWGHEFRTDYLKLAAIRESLGQPGCLALTATATPAVQKDIVSHLNMTGTREHIYSVDRPNISLHVKKAAGYEEKITLIKDAVLDFKKPGIVYTATRAEAEMLSQIIKNQTSIRTASYHGGMEGEDRILVQQQFIRDELDVVFCTNAFGMGINKSNIQFVLHAHIPQSVEHYVQETGRAGRGGGQSAALLIYTEEDRYLPLSFIDYEVPSKEEVKHFFAGIKSRRKNGDTSILLSEFMGPLGFDETKERLFQYHLEYFGAVRDHHLMIENCRDDWEERLIRFFDERKVKKRKQLTAMEKIIETEDNCLREQVLGYFGEAKKEKITPCCSGCNDKPVFATGAEREEDHSNDTGTWKALLSEVF